MSNRGFLIAAISMGFWVWIAGCNTDDDFSQEENHNQSAGACEEGETEAGCECADGSTGYRECDGDGEFGEQCICENACGGSSELSFDGEPVDEPGGECGPCEDGEIVCDGEDSLRCSGASPASACMPTGSVELTAYHQDWEALVGERRFSVFAVEEFSRDCPDVIDELDSSRTLQLVEDGEVSAPIEATVEGVPVSTDYTLVGLIYRELDGSTISYAVGCRDIELQEEGESLVIDDMEIHELPSQVAEEYRVSVPPVFDSGDMLIDRLEDLAQELEFSTADMGDQLLDCLIDGSCTSGNAGAIAYVALNWEDVEPFTQSWPLSDLWWHIDHLDNTSEDIFGHDDYIWYFFGLALDDRWASMTGSDQGSEAHDIGYLTLVGTETLTAELMTTPGLGSDFESGDSPWEFAMYRDVSLDVQELSWTWGLGFDCYQSNDTPAFDDPGCTEESIAAADINGASMDGDLVLRLFGSRYMAFEALGLDLPLPALIDEIWTHNLGQLEAEHSLGAGNFFSTLFNCSLLESDIRSSFEDERDDGYINFKDAELDTMMDAFEPFCEAFEDHGQDYFAAAFKAAAVDYETSLAGADVELQLYDGNLDDRYLLSFGPQDYPDPWVAWQRPLFDHIDYDGASCEHYVYDDGASGLEFCTMPTIEAVGW